MKMCLILNRFVRGLGVVLAVGIGTWHMTCSGAIYTIEQRFFINDTTTDWTNNFTANKFDTTAEGGRTLLSVDYTIYGALHIGDPFYLTNKAGSTFSEYAYQVYGTNRLWRPASGGVLDSVSAIDSADIYAPPGFSTAGLTSNYLTTMLVLLFPDGWATVNTATLQITRSLNLSEVQAFESSGPATMLIPFEGLSAAALTDNNNTDWSIRSSTSNEFVLLYSYELSGGAVPEPTTWFCGVALLGIGVGTAIREARRRKAS